MSGKKPNLCINADLPTEGTLPEVEYSPTSPGGDDTEISKEPANLPHTSVNGNPAPRIGVPPDFPQTSTSCSSSTRVSSSNILSLSSGEKKAQDVVAKFVDAQLEGPPTSTSSLLVTTSVSLGLEIGQSDVVPQHLHPVRLPRADDRESRYRLLEKGGGKGRVGHIRGKRRAEDSEKNDLDFLNNFSEALLEEPEIAPNTALVNVVWQSDGSRHTLDRNLTRAGSFVLR